MPRGATSVECIEGSIRRILHSNPQTGFTVAVVKQDGGGELGAVSYVPGLQEGVRYRLYGTWGQHPKYGKQFRITRFEMLEPTTVEGIVAFLSSGLFRGIGPTLARRIAEHFGEQTLDIIRNHPDRLLEVDGISHGRLQQILSSYREARAYEEAITLLAPYGISEGKCIRAVNHFGKDAVRVIREQPYRLCEIEGIGFITADRIAAALGVPPDDESRIRYATLHVLHEATFRSGHAYLPLEQLLAETCSLLDGTGRPVSRTMVEMAVFSMLDPASGDKQLEDDPDIPGHAVYLPWMWRCERDAAEDVVRIATSSVRKVPHPSWAISQAEAELDITLDPMQQEALRAIAEHPLVVVTGGPGTGKTTIMRAAIAMLRNAFPGHRILLASPTGKAAKRLSEATGMEAKTIHRMLEYRPAENRFARDRWNPLDADAVIIDESSMLDLPLFSALVRAIPSGCRLVLVGDVDQLPSVGPGNVLRDIIGSGVARVVYLTTIHRQAQDSGIVRNAHRVNQGLMPEPRSGREDFVLIEEPDHDMAAVRARDMVLELADRYGLENVQVLTPLWKTSTGVLSLNSLLQEALNPPSPAKPELVYGGQAFRPGDKVLQMENDYDRGVFNGDVGVVSSVDPDAGLVVVRFGDTEAQYRKADLEALSLAYAMTIHRSQGSEWDAVVVVLTTQHYVMLARNLLYTAITRAREFCAIVGTRKAIAMAVRNHKVGERHSALKERMAILMTTSRR